MEQIISNAINGQFKALQIYPFLEPFLIFWKSKSVIKSKGQLQKTTKGYFTTTKIGFPPSFFGAKANILLPVKCFTDQA